MLSRLFSLMCLGVALATPAAVGQPNPPVENRRHDAGPVNLSGGFADHTEPGDGGSIDWTNGFILGRGVGYGQGRDKQQELLAHEAARTLALRNALALTQGIRIDAGGTVAGLRDGLVRVQGVIRGHQEVESRWLPHKQPPESQVVMRVPLWGVDGVATVFAPTHRARQEQVGAPRRALIVERVDVTDFVLVVDARGRGLATSLFPVIRDADGGVLYDLSTLPEEWAGQVPPARFVESDLSFEELRAAVEAESPSRFLLASFRTQPAADDEQAGGTAAAGPPGDVTTQPTTQPTETPKRRAKRRMAVQAAGASGNEATQVVLTREDVDRIRRSPEAASALRSAQVIIVVDAAAAGTEARLKRGTDSEATALLEPILIRVGQAFQPVTDRLESRSHTGHRNRLLADASRCTSGAAPVAQPALRTVVGR